MFPLTCKNWKKKKQSTIASQYSLHWPEASAVEFLYRLNAIGGCGHVGFAYLVPSCPERGEEMLLLCSTACKFQFSHKMKYIY